MKTNTTLQEAVKSLAKEIDCEDFGYETNAELLSDLSDYDIMIQICAWVHIRDLFSLRDDELMALLRVELLND